MRIIWRFALIKQFDFGWYCRMQRLFLLCWFSHRNIRFLIFSSTSSRVSRFDIISHIMTILHFKQIDNLWFILVTRIAVKWWQVMVKDHLKESLDLRAWETFITATIYLLAISLVFYVIGDVYIFNMSGDSYLHKNTIEPWLHDSWKLDWRMYINIRDEK